MGSKAAVWEVKDPLLASSYEDSSEGYIPNTGSIYHSNSTYGNGSQYGHVNTPQYRNTASMYGGPAPSLVGGISGGQMYGGNGAGKGAYGGKGYPPNGERY